LISLQDVSKNTAEKRTTVSLAKVVWDIAVEMTRTRGFNDNFSAYVADLVRRDKEREEAKPQAPGNSSNSTSPSPPAHAAPPRAEGSAAKKRKAA